MESMFAGDYSSIADENVTSPSSLNTKESIRPQFMINSLNRNISAPRMLALPQDSVYGAAWKRRHFAAQRLPE